MAKKEKEIFSIKKPLLILYIISIILFMIVIYFMVGIFWNKDLKSSAITESDQAYRLFENNLDYETLKINGLIDFLECNKEIQKAWKSKSRKNLLKECLPIFDNIKNKYKITHFYFHDKDKVNFIRIHNPEKYGDIITRFTIEESFKTGEVSSGIELGPLGTFTLRVVKPWIVDGKLLGYIELGEEIEHLTSGIAQSLILDLIFIVDKQFLVKENWENGLKVFKRNGDWNQFEEKTIISSSLNNISNNLTEQISDIIEKTENISTLVIIGEKKYLAIKKPLMDVSGKEVGSTLILNDITEELVNVFLLRIKVLVVILLIGSLIFYFFYKRLGKMDSKYSKISRDLRLTA
jgi:hypothetical protein